MAVFVDQTKAMTRKMVERSVILGSALQEAQQGARLGSQGAPILPNVVDALRTAVSELASLVGVSALPHLTAAESQAQKQKSVSGTSKDAGKKGAVKK